jgi:hypothetical protein
MTKPKFRPQYVNNLTSINAGDTLPGKALVLFTRHDTPTLPILIAVNDLWREIQSNHPGTPNVNIVLQASDYAHGHFAPGSWVDQNGTSTHELMLSTVSLAMRTNSEFSLGGGVIKTVSTLLHEAAHAYAHENNVKDTSRNGRWHNKRFALLAERFGCVVEPNKQIGHVTDGITPSTRAKYQKQIDALNDAVTVYRKSSGFDWSQFLTNPGAGPVARKPRANYGSKTLTISCQCREQRVSREFFESLVSAPICSDCNEFYV